MVEKLQELRELIKAKKNDEAIEKIDEWIAECPQACGTDEEKDKPTIGGGGSGLPINKV